VGVLREIGVALPKLKADRCDANEMIDLGHGSTAWVEPSKNEVGGMIILGDYDAAQGGR